MKHCINHRLLILAMLLCFVLMPVYAHPGKTDANGGHYDHSTGEYHYHHGYPAHDHRDIDGDGHLDCPYNFDDKTGQNSSASGSSPGTTGSAGEVNRISFLDILHAMLICLVPALLIGAGVSYLLFYLCLFVFRKDIYHRIVFIIFIAVSFVSYILLIVNHLK